jgi:hypothetical protein
MWHRPYLGMSQEAIYALQTTQRINTKTLAVSEISEFNILNLLKDQRERPLLISTLIAFVLLCLVEIRFPVCSIFIGTPIEGLLTADGTKSILSGLLIGLISAYIFYVFIDFIPRTRKERETMVVLNSLIAATLDSYSRCRMFGHETALPHVDKSVLEKDWLENTQVAFKHNKSKYLSLLFAMQTSYTRLEDFRHVLPLAVSLSPKHTMQWLVIIDKIRLLAENYGGNPEVPIEKQHLIDKSTEDNPILEFKSTLNFRMLEVVEESIKWLYPSKNG